MASNRTLGTFFLSKKHNTLCTFYFFSFSEPSHAFPIQSSFIYCTCMFHWHACVSMIWLWFITQSHYFLYKKANMYSPSFYLFVCLQLVQSFTCNINLSSQDGDSQTMFFQRLGSWTGIVDFLETGKVRHCPRMENPFALALPLPIRCGIDKNWVRLPNLCSVLTCRTL